MQKSYYHEHVSRFLKAEELSILGELTRAHGFALEHQQRHAWLEQIALLKTALAGFSDGDIYFEFSIPRMGKRADVIIVLPNLVLVLEFKVGAISFARGDIAQVHDYALDLKNFHNGSHDLPIVPILCATQVAGDHSASLVWHEDWVAEPVLIGAGQLAVLLSQLAAYKSGSTIDPYAWLAAGYKPTPTIIEAAQALFQQHGVEEITRSDAGARNLTATTEALEQIIEQATYPAAP